MKRLLLVLCCLASFAPPASASPGDAATAYLDMTYPFDEKTLYWPTARPFRLEVVHKGATKGGFHYEANNFCAAEHGGTHIDAPVHFARGQRTVDEVPLSALIGPAVVVDISERAERDPDTQLLPADLERWEARHGAIPSGAILLVRTGWGQRWPDRRRYLGTDRTGNGAIRDLHFPGISPAAAEWLVARREVRAVGIDTASLDHGPSQDFRTHQILFQRGIPGLENVAQLDRLPPLGATVYAIPMKIRGGSGAPCRIFATGAIGGASGAECKQDSDCVMAQVGCCGCSAGGKQRAVPRSQAEREEQQREQRCQRTRCPMVMSNDPSCRQTARCQQGMCAPRGP